MSGEMKNDYRYFDLNRERRRLRNASRYSDAGEISLKKSRLCLKCGVKFSSTGPYHRVCDKCASTNSRISYRSLCVGSTGSGVSRDMR